jgi:RNA polymerase sigma-70 factor (ECF subfamily)
MTATILPFRRLADADELSDEVLLASCALGDRAALGALFDRHYEGVRGFLFHFARCEPADLDDLVQVTFETVQKSASRFEMRSGVKTWILGIARNVARHWIRSRARQRRITVALVNEPKTPAEVPSDRVLAAERVAKLRDAAAKLTPKLQEVFVLVYLRGLSGPEAAEVLGVREGTIWKRLHSARKKIMGAIKEES